MNSSAVEDMTLDEICKCSLGPISRSGKTVFSDNFRTHYSHFLNVNLKYNIIYDPKKE